MSLTREIPKTAMPIVEILRRDVPMPKDLPSSTGTTRLHWGTWREPICPMGLHPEALGKAPGLGSYFPPCSDNETVGTFGNWWDEQTDAQAAVNAVWPE